jgi:hypothetical protein
MGRERRIAPKWVAVANSGVRLSQARIGSGGACTGTARDRCSDKTGTPVSARAGWGVVSELDDSFRDPAPCRRAVLIIGSANSSARAVLSSSARPLSRLSLNCAARQLSISGTTPPKYTVAVDKV